MGTVYIPNIIDVRGYDREFCIPIYDCMSFGLQTDPYALNKVTAFTVHLPFVGFTYTHNSKLCDRPPPHQDTNGGTGQLWNIPCIQIRNFWNLWQIRIS